MIKLEKCDYQSEGFTLSATLNVADGKFCAVLGPSGAGKSTLLSIIAGFEKINSGSIILNDVDCTNVSAAHRPISMIFQDNNIFPHLSVWDNVALGISPSLRLNEAQKGKVDEALHSVEIEHYANKRPGEISGGERQRIAMARVLVREKKILLLDEPFAALDPGLRQSMLRQLLNIHREKNLTVLMITHQPNDARVVADEVIFIERGIVRPPQSVDSFFASKNPAIQAYLGWHQAS